jgi:hypothetical protein
MAATWAAMNMAAANTWHQTARRYTRVSTAARMEGRSTMIWDDDISFEGFQNRIDDWYANNNFELCDPPINAQFALDLIFKTLIDDKKHYPYLTAIPESTEQTNTIMLYLILKKYSRSYRRFLKERKIK